MKRHWSLPDGAAFTVTTGPTVAWETARRFLRICYRDPNSFLNRPVRMLTPAIVKLLETGVSVVVGTRDAALMPECTRAWGITLAPDRRSVTVYLTEAISRQTLRNLKDNGQIAVSCTRPTDHVACQLKGRVRTIRPATAREAERSRAWHREFVAELVAIGVPPELGEAWITEPALAVDIDVTDVFHQTPGPGTGERL